MIEQINFFRENGFVILKKIYTIKECNEILLKLNEVAPDDYSQLINVHKKEFLYLQSIKKIINSKNMQEKYNYLKNFEFLSSFFLKKYQNKKLLNFIQKLYKKKIVGVQSQVIFKKPSSKFGKQVYLPHQDNSYAKNKNNLFFTTHLFLEKSNKNNGTIYVYNKTHKLGLKKFVDKKSYGNSKKAGNYINVSEINKKYNITSIEANPGDVLIMHGNLIHGSYENKSKTKSRTTFSLCCIPKNEKFLPGKNACRETFSLISK